METATTVKHQSEYYTEFYDTEGHVFHRTALYSSLEDLQNSIASLLRDHFKPFIISYTTFKIEKKIKPIKRINL